MAIKKQVDLPVWEWCRFTPVATATAAVACAGEGTAERYIYYWSTTFYRYDTWTDSWQQLATPVLTPVTAASMRYTSYGGHRGNILGATSTTATIAGLQKDFVVGKTIRITSGTGAGQERTINAISDNTLWDHGVMTTVTTTALAAQSFADSSKKWAVNQWIGYQVRIVYGTGSMLIRKVLYNDANTIYFYDPNYQQLEPWNNTSINPFQAPNALPVVSGSSAGSHYFIESSDITVNSAWDVTPDESSSYVIFTGGIWLFSALAAAPFNTFQYYDIATDTWMVKTPLPGLATPTASAGGYLFAAMGTDVSIERTGEVSGAYLTGTSSAATARTLTKGVAEGNMVVDRWANYQLRITSGSGMGQKRRIVGNTTSYFEVEKPFDITPDAASGYAVYGNTDRIYLAGGALASLFQYDVESDLWAQGEIIDTGEARNLSVRYAGQEAFSISSSSIFGTAVLSVNTTPTAGGTGYKVGDLNTITVASGNARVRVTAVNSNGVVTAIELYSCGTAGVYTTGAGKATTTDGSGSGCTVEILTVGNACRITLATNHNLLVGDSVTIAGATVGAWNNTFTVIGTDTINIIEVAAPNGVAPVANSSQAVGTLVDAAKNWTASEHIGKIVVIYIAGTVPTIQKRRITANTATTLTLQSNLGTAAVNGTSRYIIMQPEAFGRDEQYKIPAKANNGWATSGTATTLVDSTKNWNNNQWANYKFRVIAGTGVGSEVTITSNTVDTLTYSAPGWTADTTTKYLIMDTFGIATAASATTITDTTKNWIVNQWAGKRVRLTSGNQFLTAAATAIESTIASNTATQLTFATVTATLTTEVTYTILGTPAKGAGIQLTWVYGNSVSATKGKYIWLPRGASNIFDRYNITTGTWELTTFISPQQESVAAGTMYNYDGADRIFWTPATATNARIYTLNVNTGSVDCIGQPPYGHGAAVIGNRMELITTTDGYKYLYVMRHTGQEMWRSLLIL